ncbi:MAG: uroporphyrinogen decarboxylase family protein [Candidatus Merdivicinus sp.]|jgi:uroporphyrinogen decarboxylase
MINDRDLLRATARRERQEQLLYYASFAGTAKDTALNGYHVADYQEFVDKTGIFCPCYVYPKRKSDAPVFDYSKYYTDIEIPEGVKIGEDGTLNMPGSTFHFTHLISPLRNIYELEEIKKFPIFKNPDYYDFSGLQADVERIHQQGKVAAAWVGRFFETSWALRGYENLLADMIVDPEIAEYFFQNELRWNLKFATEAAKAGVDALYFGDDVGSQKAMTFSADLWRKLIKEKWRTVWNEVKKINPDIVIWYHSCGNIFDIIGDLIEVGLDILNPIQPECMDIYEIYRKYGDKLSFDGGLSTQKNFPFGTPQSIIQETETLINVFGKNGGIIVAPAHDLEPEVPFENIKAFIDTCKRMCVTY